MLATVPGLIPQFLFVVQQRALQALGRVRPIVVAVALGNLANVLAN